MTWCVYCRGTVPDGATQCPSCGKPLSDGSKVIKCPSCGKYILKKSAQCMYCGGDTRAEPSASSEAPAPTAQPAPTGEAAPVEAPAPAEETAPVGQPRSIEDAAPVTPSVPPEAPLEAAAPTAAGKPAPTARHASSTPMPAAKPAAPHTVKPRAKLPKWLLIVLAVALAAGLFFGIRAIFFKKDKAVETRAEYIASCKAVPYALVSRDPKHYEGERVTFSGTVTELVAGSTVVFHIEQVNLDGAPGSDIWYASYTPSEEDERLLREGDEITVYGECTGAEAYAVQPGETVTLPALHVQYCESADLSKLLAEQTSPAFALGETWTVDGLCSVTVTGVSRTKDRNPNTKKAPVVVYYVDYTYTNLGYRSETSDGIYVAIDEVILDSAGQVGYSYPNTVKGEPHSTPVGETCTAQCCIGLDHAGPFQLTVNVNDENLNAYTARFNILAE